MKLEHRLLIAVAGMSGILALISSTIVVAEDSKPAGSDAPAVLSPEEYDRKVTETDREHWAYQPVRRVEPPAVKNGDWVRTPIDRFVLSKLESRGWKPAEPALPHQILRRICLDLNGLPPTLDEQDQFLADPSSERLDQLADDLLQRPAYGERWARHWLDLVRYADTNGYERDGEKPFVWRYRDYVIESLNKDKPYDRFVLEQLAGDELPDANTETVIATGFYRLGPWDDEPADPDQDREDQRDDVISTISQVFLGLTIGCARCHDHKFDALTMHDYYRLSAVIAPLQRPTYGRFDVPLPAGSFEAVARQKARDEQIAAQKKQADDLRTAVRHELLNSGQSGLTPDALEAFRISADKRTPQQKQLVEQNSAAVEQQVDAALSEAQKRQLAETKTTIERLHRETPDLPQGYFLQESAKTVPAAYILLRGRATNRGPEVRPGVPTVLARQQPLFSIPADSANASVPHTTQRRLKLAQWIVDPTHPLTARVIVNRVWQHHFGEGLVRTPSDFGVAGLSPTHPELLDWLAHWFVHDARWSLKELHRLIVRSNTWRMSRTGNEACAETDPENRFLWRFPYRRLEVEALRDAMLAASGKLNRKMSGPGVYLEVPTAALEGHADKTSIWKPFDETEGSRRTVYAFVKRSLVVPMLDVLDLCDTTRSTDKRNVTSIPPQALTLLNGDFVNRQARHLAERVRAEAGPDPAKQIERLWRLALCRPPTDFETKTMLAFLREEAKQTNAGSTTSDEAAQRALIQACRAVLNLNEFAYPD